MPDDLLNTRWLFVIFQTAFGMTSFRFYHVEVVSLQGDQAVVVTCYSTPLRSWTVPIASITMQPNAFAPLGHARDFDWATRGDYVHRTDTSVLDGGTWIIEDLDSEGVHLRQWRSSIDATVRHVGWNNFLPLYRQATREEIQAFAQRRFQAPAPPPVVDPDAGLFSFTLNSEPEGPPAPRPTRWNRLDEDD